jgi:ankyrin repeat protein
MAPKAINKSNKEGNTALHYAAANGAPEIVKIFLITVPDKVHYKTINSHNKQKYTALHYAAENGHVAVVKQLIESKHVSPNTFKCVQRKW